MADGQPSAISAETLAMLDDVKKGKPRKFMLITKGATIQTLVVFKKGPFGPRITKAKKEGARGDVACGILTGKGVNLTLQLPGNSEVSNAMKAEGNVSDAEPCKIAKLRTFLQEASGTKFKPAFEIVTSPEALASTTEADEEEVPQAAIGTETAEANAAPAPASRWQDLLAEVAPQLKRVLAEKRPGFAEIGGQFKAANQLHAAGNQDEALAALQQCAERIAAALSAPAEAAKPSPLQPVLERIEPAAQQALNDPALDASARSQIEDLLKQLRMAVAQNRGDAAKALVARLVPLVKGPASPAAASEDVAAGFVRKRIFLKERWEQVPPEIDAKVDALEPEVGRDLSEQVRQALHRTIDQINAQIQENFDQGARDFSATVLELKKAKAFVQSDPLIQHLKRHPKLHDLGVEKAFLSALAELQEQLTS